LPKLLLKHQSIYNKHNYVKNHIWNSDETCIQAGKQSGARVLVKRGSHQVYNIIPKSKEWLIINYVVNVLGITLPRFYIFRRKMIHDDYIQFYKPGTCMAMQSKAWMTTSFLKNLCLFSKDLYQVEYP